MQGLAGILFVAALAFAVILGGQTIDYSWGPALLLLAPAALASLGAVRRLRERPWTAWLAAVLLAGAWGWILYGCAHSPVKEFARSDAMLVGGMALSFLFGLLMLPEGKGARLFMGGLSVLAIANGVVSFIQLGDPSFAWPFASRPAIFPSGFFGHYNHMADFAAVGSMILLARAIFARDSLGERILQGVGSVIFMICVGIAKSRGALVGLAAAAEVVAVCVYLIGLRNGGRHAKALILLPIGFLIVGSVPATLMMRSVESARGVENPGTQGFADNRSRLILWGLALRISGDHPVAGGGSRSFGWQKYRSWNSDPHAKDGKMPSNDDFAHNEMLQAAVDYGWTGAGLVLVAVVTTGLAGIAGLTVKDEHARTPRMAADATVIGGLAAVTATLVNSNFSFVTHTLPGAMYLGLGLAMALPRRTPAPASYTRRQWSGIPVAFATLALSIPVAWAGFTASRAYRMIWPVGNRHLSISDPNAAADALNEAAKIWPASTLYNSAGQICQSAASGRMVDKDDVMPYLKRAAGFYAAASDAYPYSAHWVLNRANVLAALSHNEPNSPLAEEAEQTFEKALQLQGGMEGLLRVRYFYGQFLIYRWDALWRKHRRAEEAFVKFNYARQLLLQAKDMTEVYIQGNQIVDLLDQVNKKIEYMEGAGFTLPGAAVEAAPEGE